MENVRYIAGISGGAWATSTYIYHQSSGSEDDETRFLGSITEPNEINLEDLQKMDPNCARAFANGALEAIAVKAYLDGSVDSLPESWAYAVSKVYLEPTGVPRNSRFSWTAETVAEIKARNPSLEKESFVLPTNEDRPFMVIGSTVLGPVKNSPYKPDTQNFTMLEFTPMYVGQLCSHYIDYQAPKNDIIKGRTITRRVGGAVEPFVVGRSGRGPKNGIPEGETSAELEVPAPEGVIDLAFAAGACSYAPGAVVSGLPPDFVAALGLDMSYWSPVDVTPPAAMDTLLADGGSYQNVPLINLIQRRVQNIVVFFLARTPLQPSSSWDVYNDPYTDGQATNDLGAFFGALPETWPNYENRSFDLSRNQVFATEDYATVVSGLQKAQERGEGVIATFSLTTVENAWWGVPAGLTFEVTFFYLGRLFEWEAQLSEEMYSLAVPADPADAADPSKTVQEGPFKNFPHYSTSGGDLSFEQANLLADLTGWSVLQNEAQFRKILSSDS